MNTFVRLFPDYEDVFFDEIEKHRTYFLPLCSFNLQLIDPRLDQWLHIVSVKEIYDGCIGQNTTPYHRHFTQLDSIGFDIIDGNNIDDGYYCQHASDPPFIDSCDVGCLRCWEKTFCYQCLSGYFLSGLYPLRSFGFGS